MATQGGRSTAMSRCVPPRARTTTFSWTSSSGPRRTASGCRTKRRPRETRCSTTRRPDGMRPDAARCGPMRSDAPDA
eukprot:6634619-Prymnesium_polylepis.1